MGRVILQSLSRNESDETHESQRNKDAVDACDACDTPSVGVPVLRLVRLTLMWSHLQRVGLLKSQHSLSLDCYNRYIQR